MPVKIKKEKKIKQKQKQSQKQVVNIKIGEIKKGVRRRVVTKKSSIVQQSVHPVQYLYQASGSVAPRQDYQNIGVARQAQQNILAEQPEIRQPEVRQVQEPLQIGVGAEAKQNLLGGAVLQPEDIRRQRELRLYEPVEKGLFADYPSVPTPIEEEVNFEEAQIFRREEPLGGGSKTETARKVRRALQISESAGREVPLERLLQGYYGVSERGNPRRQPTIYQRQLLYDAGEPIAGDEYGVIEKPRKKKE
jgi:hypothetical protein